MGLFIENNSNYGDVIVIVVRGRSDVAVYGYDSQVRTILRKIGVDRLPDCTLTKGCCSTFHS